MLILVSGQMYYYSICWMHQWHVQPSCILALETHTHSISHQNRTIYSLQENKKHCQINTEIFLTNSNLFSTAIINQTNMGVLLIVKREVSLCLCPNNLTNKLVVHVPGVIKSRRSFSYCRWAQPVGRFPTKREILEPWGSSFCFR